MARPKDYEDYVDEHLRECVAIDELAIQEEYIRLPADLAYWGAKYAEADRAYLLAKIELDRTERILYGRHRAALMDTEKRPTEAMISGVIGEDPQWYEAEVAAAEAEAKRAALRGAVEAIKAKREVIISLGAHLRLEMMRDPVLRDQVKDAREHAREQADSL